MNRTYLQPILVPVDAGRRLAKVFDLSLVGDIGYFVIGGMWEDPFRLLASWPELELFLRRCRAPQE